MIPCRRVVDNNMDEKKMHLYTSFVYECCVCVYAYYITVLRCFAVDPSKNHPGEDSLFSSVHCTTDTSVTIYIYIRERLHLTRRPMLSLKILSIHTLVLHERWYLYSDIIIYTNSICGMSFCSKSSGTFFRTWTWRVYLLLYTSSLINNNVLYQSSLIFPLPRENE